MSEALIQVKGLKVHFHTDEGVVKAVDGVDFSIYRGKTLCVVGESGSGKSVTTRAILQILHKAGRIEAGEIRYHRAVNGSIQIQDIATIPKKSKQMRQIRGNEISMIFQEPMTSLSPMYTVGNQIMEAILLHKAVSQQEARNRAIELLGHVGIPKPDRIVDEYPFRLSGGMRQRVMIAMALSCNPNLLIADEPTTALDVTTQAQILDLMARLQEEHDMAILFITHDLGVVAEIADDVAVMYLGTVVENSDVDTIFNNPKHPYTQALLRSIPKIGPERGTLDAIAGMVPSPFRRPKGCVFHTRCDHVLEPICLNQAPPPISLARNHTTRCWLYEGKSER